MKKTILIGLAIVCVLVLSGCTKLESDTELPPGLVQQLYVDTNPVIAETIGFYTDSEGNAEAGVTLYNYGLTQVSDVVLQCVLVDYDMRVRGEVIENVGNIAGGTTREVYMKIDKSADQDNHVLCKLVNCANCEILWKQIPELVNVFEDGKIFRK